MEHKINYIKRLANDDYLGFDNPYEYSMFSGGTSIKRIFSDFFWITGMYFLILLVAVGLIALLSCFQ